MTWWSLNEFRIRGLSLMSIEQHNPLHPGVFIKRVYLEPFNVGAKGLAERLRATVVRTPRRSMATMSEMIIAIEYIMLKIWPDSSD